MEKIRTIQEIADMIKEQDPDTQIKGSTIRKAVRAGEIPSRKVGNKYFVNYNIVLEYFGIRIKDVKG